MPFNDDYKEMEKVEIYSLFAHLFMEEPSDEMIIHVKDVFQMKFSESYYDIRMDFIRIFSGTKGHLLPYESMYNYPVWDKPRLWGRAAEEVHAFYSSTGIMIDEEISIIPDHISAELLFMSYLIENGLTEHRIKFLREHLFRWVPEYCDEIQRHANSAFYKEVANILKEFILSDYELMSE